jgi:quinate dehydrogenase
MPFKGEIRKHIDRIDNVASTLKACNSVYFDENGRLCGSNTDWIGVEGALRSAGFEGESIKEDMTAAIIGAGGAARAALYALSTRFRIKTIYVLNRDDEEVAQLVEDCKEMPCQLQHLKSIEQAVGLDMPSVIVGSIPDFESISPEEKTVRQVYQHFLSQGNGIMIDFCYNPLDTRNIQLAKDHGWRTIQGIEVVGHQVEALWRLWIDEERLNKLDRAGMWQVLHEAAALDSKGRQTLNAEIVKRHFGDQKTC